jgi:hypothetical protein
MLLALDNAANAKATSLDPIIYERMCSYCAFLWNMCPFSKAVAPVNYVKQMMLDLKHGNVDSLDALGVKDEDIDKIKQHYANGGSFIITGKNYRQLVYRLQFAKQLAYTYKTFRDFTKWTVARLPIEIELPIADMALIHYPVPAIKSMRTILPISPKSILMGIEPLEQHAECKDTIVYGGELDQTGAEYLRDIICESAILALASKTRIGDISAWRKKGLLNPPVIQNIDAALKAGEAPIMSEQDFKFTPATAEAYLEWESTFVKPNPNIAQQKNKTP